jgi:cytochrome d ubiquinol oxidase subunit I
MAVSAWYLLGGRHREFARRSMTVAASFGLASALSAVVLGDESGYSASQNQKMKIAAIEAMWETEPAPASFTIFGIPDSDNRVTRDALRVPWALGLIATRSLDTEIPGIKDLVAANVERIRSGMIAYDALSQLRHGPPDTALRAVFDAHVKDLGYGLLLKRYTQRITDATPEQVDKAAWDTVPNVATLFWSFRVMVGIGFFFIAFFGLAFWLSAKRRFADHRWFLRLAVLAIPLPWISSELGWIVAENGRQPWTIDGVLPTFLSASSLSAHDVWLSLAGFVAFYSLLAVVEFCLMIKYIRLGPEAALDLPLPAAGGRR